MRIVYSPAYNIGFWGFERLHPFDSRKYGRAWRAIQRELGSNVKRYRLSPTRPINHSDLLRVHAEAYLAKLHEPKYVAGALEVPLIARIPSWIVDWCVLRPMRWQTAGTVVGMRAALECGLAVNLGGGFHHAKQARGEGFCVYSDIGVAVAFARLESLIGTDSRIAYIDLDAHQGNGVSHIFRDDRSFFILDMYNSHIYPSHDVAARERIDCDLPITHQTTETEYLDTLRRRLPGFLDSIGSKSPVGFAIYNAGTDVVDGDPLGNLRISANGVLERDLYVVGELRKRNIPTLMLLSGGYTKSSYKLIATSVAHLAKLYAN